MSLIAVDIDDVKFPFVKGLCEFHNRYYRTRLSVGDFHTYQFSQVFGCSHEEGIRRIDEYHESDMFREMLPIERSQDAIHHLSKDFRIIDITSRRPHNEERTHEWISHYFPEVEEVVFSDNCHVKSMSHLGRKTKAQICLELGVKFIIEDNSYYALECAQKGILVYLFDQPWNRDLDHKNIVRISRNGRGYWDNCLEEVYKEY